MRDDIKIPEDTIEFRAEIRNILHVMTLRQDETTLTLQNHIDKVEPILEALMISKILVRVIKWTSIFLTVVASAYLTIKQVVRG